MAEEPEDGGTKGGRAPPYIAFQTLKTFLDELQKHGTPNRVDRSVLTRFSGAVGSQLMSALKFLQLISEDAKPTVWLSELVAAYGTDNWQGRLGRLLRDSYTPIFRMNLQSATPSQFNEVFRQAYPTKENVLRKCTAFFLNASREAGIEISPRVLKNSKPPRPVNGAPVRRKPASTAEPLKADSSVSKASQTVAPRPERASSQVLLDMLDPSAMSDDEQKAVWTLLLYLKKSEVKQPEV